MFFSALERSTNDPLYLSRTCLYKRLPTRTKNAARLADALEPRSDIDSVPIRSPSTSLDPVRQAWMRHGMQGAIRLQAGVALDHAARHFDSAADRIRPRSGNR